MKRKSWSVPNRTFLKNCHLESMYGKHDKDFLLLFNSTTKMDLYLPPALPPTHPPPLPPPTHSLGALRFEELDPEAGKPAGEIWGHPPPVVVPPIFKPSL